MINVLYSMTQLLFDVMITILIRKFMIQLERMITSP